MLRWIFAFAGFAAAGAACFALSPRYTGSPIVQVFTERDLSGSPHTRMVAVHPNGLIYVATIDGLMEYDGVTWRMIPGTSGLIVHNLAIDAAGRVWYSGKDEFGVLVPDENGQLVARPMQQKLLPADREVGHVLSVATNGAEVFFATQGVRSFIVRADAAGGFQELALPNPRERCRELFTLRGEVFAITTVGVYRVSAGQLQPAPDAQVLHEVEVRSVWPRAAGGAWVVSAGGLRLWQGAEAPLVAEDMTQRPDGARVLCGCPLADGTFALGTDKSGVLIVDSEGHLLSQYDESDGLGSTSNTISAVTPDPEGGMWLAYLGGVTRLQIPSPAFLHNRAAGVRSRVEGFALHRGRLLVATTEGVFERDPATGHFDERPNGGVDAWQMISTEEGLIVAGADLRLVRDDGDVELIERERLLFRSVLRLPRDPDRIVASTGPGQLRVYRREGGHWRFEGRVPAVHEVLFDLTQDTAGWLWATSRNRRDVVRLDWRRGVQLRGDVETMDAARGLPAFRTERKNVWLFLLGGRVEVTSALGLWRYDEAADRFAPETRIEGFDAARWSRVYPLGDGSLWLANATGEDPAALVRPAGPDAWKIETLPYTGFESIQPRVMFDELATHTLWIGYQGLASYDRAWAGAQPPSPTVRVRSVTAENGKIIWGGVATTAARSLSADQNALQFAYAAISFRPDVWASVPMQYRTRLEGFDRQWSTWSTATRRDYTNLSPGKFSFRVEARDGVGRVGAPATFSFVLPPPWWRTWWFVLLALAAAIALVAAVTRGIATRALRRRLARLEAQTAVERERLRLARDLHDEVGSGLGRVILFAGEARRAAGDPALLDASLDRVRATAQELVQHAREIVWAVSPQHDTLASLGERLGDYAAETLRAANIACRFDLPPDLPAIALGSEVRHTVFLSVKEALHNSVKYSGATEVKLRTRWEGGVFLVEISDNGVGFAPGERQGGGHGLRNLRLRAEGLGGSAEITSERGRGTSVTLRIPIALE